MNEPSRSAARMALAYALAATAWIVASDYVLRVLAGDGGSFAHLGMLKWLGFVAVTSALLFWFMRREFSFHVEERERLRKSEERLRVLVEQAVDAFFVHDENGKFVEVNRRACESLGYSKEELLRMSVTDVEMDFDLNRGKKAWAQVQPGRDFMLVGRHRRKDGSTFPVEAHLGLLDADGRRLFLGLVRDITERERAEAELRQSEEKFARIFRSSPVAVALTRAEDGRIIDANESYCRLSGYTREELIGHTTTELKLLVNPGERARHVETLRAGGRIAEVETSYRHRSGEIREVLISCELTELGGAQVILGISRDITESKRAETALRAAHESAQMLASLGRYLTEATSAKEAGKRIFHAADQLFGWDSCWLQLWRETDGKMETIINMDFMEGERREIPLPLDTRCEPTPMARRVLKEGAQLVLRQNESEATDGLELFGSKRRSLSSMFVPIRHRGHAVGVISIQSYEANAYDNEALSLFQSLADHCASTLERISAEVERERAVETEREVQTRLRLAVQASNVGLWDWDIATNTFHFSPEWKSQLGYAANELSSSFGEWENRLHPADRERTTVKLQDFLAGEGRTYTAEFRLRHRDGSYRWIYTRAQVFRDAAGRPIRMLGGHIDITDRKRAEDALAESENRLRTVLQSQPECVNLLAEDGTVLEMNPAGLTMIEADSPAQVIGHNMAVWVQPKHQQAFKDMTSRVFAGVASLLEFEICGLKGARRLLETRVTPLRDQQGRIIAALGVTRDLTEQKQAELARLAAEMKFRSLVEQSIAGIYVIQDERFAYVNPKMAEIFMTSVKDLTTRPLLDFIFEEDHPKVKENIRLRLSGEVPSIHYELRMKRGGAALIHVEVHGARIEWNGRPAILGILLDVTERKQAEQQLLQQTEALHELSARLLQLQDEERRRIARELHDTTAQNLAALAMNLSVLEQLFPGDKAPATKLFADCGRLVERSATEIRTFSYLLHPPALDAFGLARTAQDYVQGFAQRSGIRVETDIPDDFARLPREFEVSLFRVLQESLGNVHRHSGSPTVSVRLARAADDVVLEVRDEGRGLGAREDEIARGLDVSIGVGIAGMRERLRQLGGRLEIKPALPGTLVRATLPLTPGQS